MAKKLQLAVNDGMTALVPYTPGAGELTWLGGKATIVIQANGIAFSGADRVDVEASVDGTIWHQIVTTVGADKIQNVELASMLVRAQVYDITGNGTTVNVWMVP